MISPNPGALIRPVPHVVAVRCNWCSKQRPHFRVHQLSSNQVICDNCLDWHSHALEVLSGGVPKGCQECQTTWDALRDATPGEQVRMYVVPKDGINQLLCRSCTSAYVRKRKDVYGDTEFGKQLGL